MIIEGLQIPVGVDVEITVIGNGIAKRRAILKFRSAHPWIVCRITCICIKPVEYRQFVQWQLIWSCKRLLIVKRCSQILYAVPYRVFPSMILVWIKVFVHWHVWFLNLRMSGRLEIHSQILCEVPSQWEVTVPKELLTECQRKVRVFHTLHIPFLQFIVVAQYLCIESNILWKIVKSQCLWEIKPFALSLKFLKRFPCLIHRRITIVQWTAPLVFVLIYSSLSRCLPVWVTVTEWEIGWVVWHWMALGLYAHTHIWQREVGILCLSHCKRFYWVALMVVCSCFQCIVKKHIAVKRIIFRTSLFLGYRIIQRRRHLGLVWEELA